MDFPLIKSVQRELIKSEKSQIGSVQDMKNTQKKVTSGSQPKPDDRSNNVDRIKRNIDMTIHNIEAAEDMMSKTDNPSTKRDLSEKNERREQALDGMRSEIRDEAGHQKHQNK
jgi:small acid-soluble spore protein (thioredoxin-like protein)